MNDETETETTPDPGQEVVPARRPELAVGDQGYIVPQTIEEAYRMAKAIVAGNLAPDSYAGSPEKVMLGLMAAMEAGLPPMYGLRNIAIIGGRPVAWGDSLMALVQSKGLLAKQEVEELLPKDFDPDATELGNWPGGYGYEVRLFRRGQDAPFVGRYTVADAKRQSLWMNSRKQPWITSPRRMLLIRARAFPLRDGFADALAGIAVREEVEDVYAEPKAVDAGFLSAEPQVQAPPLPEEEEERT